MSEALDLAIFVDALGWEMVEETGFLSDLLPHRHPVETVLGYSCACIPTILTGKRPSEHGHFSFFRYAPERSPFGLFPALGALPRAISGRGRFRNLLSRVTRQILGYTGYFQLYNVPFHYLPYFEYTETRDLYRPGGILGGQPTLFDELERAGVPHGLSDWRAGDARNLERARRELSSGRVRFHYLYLPGLDQVLHSEGTRGEGVATRLSSYESRIRDLIATAERAYGRVRVHLFSDHGMADVREHLDVPGRLEHAGLRFGTDYVAMIDSTMARFWFLRPQARERAGRALEAPGLGRILEEPELRERGCWFEDGRYGEMIFLARSGVLLHPSFMGENPVAGMHGYAPGEAHTRACYLSSEPPSRAPVGLWDLKELLLEDCLPGTGGANPWGQPPSRPAPPPDGGAPCR